jgi:hypothetical protein
LIRSDFAAQTRDYITDYIKFADSKAGAVLAVGVAVGGVIGGVSKAFLQEFSHTSALIMAPAAVSGVVVAAATAMLLFRAIEALAPDVKPVDSSLASFPDIASDPQSFLARSEGLTDTDAIAREFEKHSVQLARIAKLKFDRITQALGWLRIQVFGTYALVLLYVIAALT